MNTQWLACWVSVLLAWGCVPFLTPPLRAELGAGTLDDSALEPHSTDSEPPDGTVLARVGLHPLQLASGLADRVVDVGVGYGIEGVEGTSIHRAGPYVELAAFPLRGKAGRGPRWRAGVLAVGDYAAYPGGPLGDASAFVGATAELTGFSNTTFATEDTAGVAYGEWGVGLFAGPSVRIGADQATWAGSAGVTARIPMTFGLACCLKPELAADSVARHEKRAHRKKHGAERRLRRKRKR